MSSGSDSLFNDPNLTFNLWDMFVSRCHVQRDVEICQVVSQWSKLPVHEESLYFEASRMVEGPDVLYSRQDVLDLAACKMLQCCEFNVVTHRSKKGTLLMKKMSPDKSTFLLASITLVGILM